MKNRPSKSAERGMFENRAIPVPGTIYLVVGGGGELNAAREELGNAVLDLRGRGELVS